jgi:hypothetical protein
MQATVHMLTSMRGYLEVYEREVTARAHAESDEAAEIISQRLRNSTCDAYPTDQLATYLSHHVDLVQQMSGVMPHRILAQSIAPLESKAAELPVIVAGRLMSASLSHTFNAALRSLVELHDYQMPPGAAERANAGVPGGLTKPPQQALLALSQLHANFGHMDHAMSALMEAVDVDQGSGESEWLVTCLLQLCMLMRVVPPAKGALAKSPAAVMQVRNDRL